MSFVMRRTTGTLSDSVTAKQNRNSYYFGMILTKGQKRDDVARVDRDR